MATVDGEMPAGDDTPANEGWAVAVEIGQTSLRAGLVGWDGQVEFPFDDRSRLHEQPEAILTAVEAAVAGVITAASPTGREITALGLSSTLDVDVGSGRFRSLEQPHLRRWSDYDVRAHLADRFGLPTVVDNDGITAAWGEYRRGAGIGSVCCLSVTLGTGIGGGVVLDGQLHRNSLGSAGYVGHITIAHDGPVCHCGQRGCWELYASPAALEQRARAVLAGVGEAPPTARDVIAAARIGDPTALGLLDESATFLAVGLASLCNILNPDVIVLGGGFSAAGELLLERVVPALEQRRMPLRPQIQVRTARLGSSSGLVGAGLLALEPPYA